MHACLCVCVCMHTYAQRARLVDAPLCSGESCISRDLHLTHPLRHRTRRLIRRGPRRPHRRRTAREECGGAPHVRLTARRTLELLERHTDGAVGGSCEVSDEAALVHRALTAAASARLMHQRADRQRRRRRRVTMRDSSGGSVRGEGRVKPVPVIVAPAKAACIGLDLCGRWYAYEEDLGVANDTAATARAQREAVPTEQRTSWHEGGSIGRAQLVTVVVLAHEERRESVAFIWRRCAQPCNAQAERDALVASHHNARCSKWKLTQLELKPLPSAELDRGIRVGKVRCERRAIAVRERNEVCLFGVGYLGEKSKQVVHREQAARHS